MEFLQQILDNSPAPLISAFVLGLMAALAPCTLAANITAIAFIGKDVHNKTRVFLNGILYTVGRGMTYTGIGLLLYFGISKFGISHFFQSNGGKIIGPLFILTGIFMLGLIPVNVPGLKAFREKVTDRVRFDSPWSYLLFGIILAAAFCPYIGVLYFGMLIPLTVVSAGGLYLPVVFAIGTGLPVIIVSWLLAFSVAGADRFFSDVRKFEFWIRRFTGVIFIASGIYFTITFLF